MVQFVTGGQETGPLLASHMDIAKISFTGSIAAGKGCSGGCNKQQSEEDHAGTWRQVSSLGIWRRRFWRCGWEVCLFAPLLNSPVLKLVKALLEDSLRIPVKYALVSHYVPEDTDRYCY